MTARPSPAPGPVDTSQSPGAALRTLPAGSVTLDGVLWARRQAVNRASALPHGFRMLETAGNFENLRVAAGASKARYQGPVFMDSDVYKWLEAAAFEMAREPDAGLRASMDTAIGLVEAAQRPDGYLNSYYTVAEPHGRWSDFPHGHELYCAGHLFQGAVAHHRATGDGRLLRVATRLADFLDGEFGAGRRIAVPGHPEIEMGLVELYRETRQRRYLDLAGFFVDQRGRGLLGPGRYHSSAYYQDRVPVREASEIEGHAVRASYLAAGVTDLYLETGEPALRQAVERQWEDMIRRKIYLTGGTGSRHWGEAFGQPYELPNDLAYSETCSAIGHLMWSWRLLLATGDGRYADLMDRALHNAILSGVSLAGDRYFYVNPLASNGDPEHLGRGGCRRKEWHLVACCPPNVMRLLASLGHYSATRDASGLQVHLYGSARIDTDLGPGRPVGLRMESRYPWEGRVRITVTRSPGDPWTLALRVPAWSEGQAKVRVNGAGQPAAAAGGYLRLERPWTAGDVVELDLALAPRLVEAHPWIESTRGCLAIERGPLVYCVEQADHPGAAVPDLHLDPRSPLKAGWDEERLDGVVVIRGRGVVVDASGWQGQLYRDVGAAPEPPPRATVLTAIPYYAWANREPGAMRVWIPRAPAGG